jgi:hypothetical protein
MTNSLRSVKKNKIINQIWAGKGILNINAIVPLNTNHKMGVNWPKYSHSLLMTLNSNKIQGTSSISNEIGEVYKIKLTGFSLTAEE